MGVLTLNISIFLGVSCRLLSTSGSLLDKFASFLLVMIPSNRVAVDQVRHGDSAIILFNT